MFEVDGVGTIRIDSTNSHRHTYLEDGETITHQPIGQFDLDPQQRTIRRNVV